MIKIFKKKRISEVDLEFNYVKFSIETAKLNPQMIINEYNRLISDIHKELSDFYNKRIKIKFKTNDYKLQELARFIDDVEYTDTPQIIKSPSIYPREITLYFDIEEALDLENKIKKVYKKDLDKLTLEKSINLELLQFKKKYT